MKSWIKVAVACSLLLGANSAFAQVVNTDDNTNAGVTIGNTASVSYVVGGVTQEAASDTAEFVVDRAILVTVAKIEDDTGAPGASNQPLEFTVTNDSNAALDFLLTVEQPTGDDFDVTSVQYYLDADSNDANEGIFDGGDTELNAATIENLAEESEVTIFVVADIPDPIGPAPANGDTSTVILIATAHELGGNAVVETNVDALNEADGPDTPGTDTGVMFMDTVFGDGAGAATLTADTDATGPDLAGDGAGDGHHSAAGTYTVATADISVSKSSVVVEDPFNGTANPKAIPGATVRYCVQIENGSATAADNVTVTDNVPLNTDYVEGSLRMDTDCDLTTGTPIALDDDAIATGTEDDTDTAVNRGNVTTAPDPGGTTVGDEGTVTTIDVQLPASSTTTTIFDVVIR